MPRYEPSARVNTTSVNVPPISTATRAVISVFPRSPGESLYIDLHRPLGPLTSWANRLTEPTNVDFVSRRPRHRRCHHSRRRGSSGRSRSQGVPPPADPNGGGRGRRCSRERIGGGLDGEGDLPPRERDLAERLGISRTVVREALVVLRRAGSSRCGEVSPGRDGVVVGGVAVGAVELSMDRVRRRW